MPFQVVYLYRTCAVQILCVLSCMDKSENIYTLNLLRR